MAMTPENKHRTRQKTQEYHASKTREENRDPLGFVIHPSLSKSPHQHFLLPILTSQIAKTKGRFFLLSFVFMVGFIS
jgi:hypothetical protein